MGGSPQSSSIYPFSDVPMEIFTIPALVFIPMKIFGCSHGNIHHPTRAWGVSPRLPSWVYPYVDDLPIDMVCFFQFALFNCQARHLFDLFQESHHHPYCHQQW